MNLDRNEGQWKQHQGQAMQESPSWRYCYRIYLPKEHCTLYRDEDLRVQLQVMAKRNWSFVPPKERYYYFIDGVDRVFNSEEGMMQVLQIHFLGRTTPRHIRS